MKQLLRSRLDRGTDASSGDREEGFTLIELMVVVLIIAILIAIAIPTFLGARQKAQDRAAQSDLRNALTAVKTAYVDSQSYASDAAGGVYTSIEPSLAFGASSAKPSEISVNATASDTIVLAAYSQSGTCFEVKDVTGAAGNDTAGTFYGHSKASGSSCTASNGSGDTASSW